MHSRAMAVIAALNYKRCVYKKVHSPRSTVHGTNVKKCTVGAMVYSNYGRKI
jgi:hypothetical protein